MATAQQPSTAVARVDRREAIMSAPELKDLTTERALAIIRPRLGAGITVERVLSEVITAVQNNPQLQECTPDSLVEAVAKATSTGLIIGEKIHLVPFNTNIGTRDKPTWVKKAQAIRDYKGDIELVIRAGGARLIDAQCFYEKEPFTFRLGSAPLIEHTPLSPAKRGKMVGAYAVAKLSHYDIKIQVMYVDEINAIREKYSKSWKGGDLDSIPWYAKKTVVHQIVKQLPSTPGLDKIRQEFEAEVHVDEDIVTDAEIEDAPAAAAPARDYAWASTALFPFHKGKPSHLRPLGDLPSEFLRSAAEWVTEQQGTRVDPTWHKDTLEAIRVILGARERGEAKEPAVAKPAAAASEPPDPAPTGGRVDMPKPGAVGDALPANKPAAPSFITVVRQIQQLMDSADRTADEKAEIQRKIDAATTIVELQAVLTDLLLPV